MAPDEPNTTLFYDHPIPAVDRDGVEYRVRALAELDAGGVWQGVLELIGPGGESVRTGIETTQSSREAVQHWAAGLGAVFLQGALERAKRRAGWTPSAEAVVVREGPIVTARDGARYRSEVRAQWSGPSSWVAWLRFSALDGGRVFLTGEETSQANLSAVGYWAEGLERLYFDGALARAQPSSEECQP